MLSLRKMIEESPENIMMLQEINSKLDKLEQRIK